MAKKEKKPDTLKQKRARHYVKIILGVYLIYTAYSMVKDMHMGISADRPALFYTFAAIFLVVGATLTVTSFRAAMKISAEELKQEEMSAEETQEEAGQEEALTEEKREEV